jgi:signal transduction histidine kinase
MHSPPALPDRRDQEIARLREQNERLRQLLEQQDEIGFEELLKLNVELERKNQELEAVSREADAANRAKSEFLANMSHELRTPLNAIIGFAELIHHGEIRPDMPEHKEFIGEILAAGQHLLEVINDVLDLSKVEAGTIEFRPESVDMGEIVADVVATLQTIAAKNSIRVDTDVDPGLGNVVIDSSRIKQILYNYLSNALKFTPAGGHVTVRVRPDAATTFRIEVEDTGIGIAATDLGRLFGDFQQLDAGAAKKHAGTGLGLAITKRLVEAQHGTVGVKSILGEGSTFDAVLPRQAVAETPISVDIASPAD